MNISPVNTHRLYHTVAHIHLDTFVNWITRSFPDAGLLLVECQDGRWFVEAEHGPQDRMLPGVSCPTITPFVEPQMFPDQAGALELAFACLKHLHPELASRDLPALYAEYDRDE